MILQLKNNFKLKNLLLCLLTNKYLKKKKNNFLQFKIDFLIK